jgi:hypothetical protein
MSLWDVVSLVRGEGVQRALLGEWSENEFTLRDTDVRDREAFMVDLEVIIEEDIEVDIARALVDDLLATQCLFDIL